MKLEVVRRRARASKAPFEQSYGVRSAVSGQRWKVKIEPARRGQRAKPLELEKDHRDPRALPWPA